MIDAVEKLRAYAVASGDEKLVALVWDVIEAKVAQAEPQEGALDEINRLWDEIHIRQQMLTKLYATPSAAVQELSHEGYLTNALRQDGSFGLAPAAQEARELLDIVRGNSAECDHRRGGDGQVCLNWDLGHPEAAAEIERFAQRRVEAHTPTQWAYDQVCKARTKWQERAEKAEARLAAQPHGDAIDWCDLMVDEFTRIAHLTENEEIKGLCERAIGNTKQHFPVMQQRDEFYERYRKAEIELAGLRSHGDAEGLRWTSSDTLPNDDRAILVSTNKGKVYTGQALTDSDDGMRWLDCDTYLAVDEDITHWMEMPRAALLVGKGYARQALDLHDASYRRHPATEADRKSILEDIEQIDAAEGGIMGMHKSDYELICRGLSYWASFLDRVAARLALERFRKENVHLQVQLGIALANEAEKREERLT